MITNLNGFSDFQLGHVFASLKDRNGKGVLVNFVICMALNKVFSKRRIFVLFFASRRCSLKRNLTLLLLSPIYRVIQKMSPLAFKSNNSRPMSRTTSPYTAFERADNFLSNECIHTRFPFQIASSQATNQKSSGFCVFRFQTDFEEQHFVLSSLYRNIAFI